MKKKILITGSSGFLGSHLKKLITNKKRFKSKFKFIFTSSDEYNLLKASSYEKMFKETKPNYFINLAAYSGGIEANRKYQADFYYINNLITTYGFEFAKKYNVEKVIYTMGGCSYPNSAKSPINENDMWNGLPVTTSLGYSSAKKMSIIASYSYKEQYGLNSQILIPGNMYGEYDNFDLNNSHVIPAMIRKFYEAKINNKDEINFWGTGKPKRDFVYAGDIARAILFFLNKNKFSDPINLSSGKSISIKKLSSLLKNISGYKGKINWDLSKPDGQKIKIFDIKRMNDLGFKTSVDINTGLKKTYKWFSIEYPKKSNQLRL